MKYVMKDVGTDSYFLPMAGFQSVVCKDICLMIPGRLESLRAQRKASDFFQGFHLYLVTKALRDQGLSKQSHDRMCLCC